MAPASLALNDKCFINHHCHHCQLDSNSNHITAPQCPRHTARLQRSSTSRLESSLSWSSHLFRRRPGGSRHEWSGGRLSEVMMWRQTDLFSLSRRENCVGRTGNDRMRSGQSTAGLHRYGLRHANGFWAVASSISGENHPETLHWPLVTSTYIPHRGLIPTSL